MNIQLVSVTERTREIGLRKALGAPPWAIRRQFLVEAGILGLTGGVLGAGLGALATITLPGVIGSSIVLSPTAVVMAIGVSLAIGLVFGVYPATRAARLAPIDARARRMRHDRHRRGGGRGNGHCRRAGSAGAGGLRRHR